MRHIASFILSFLLCCHTSWGRGKTQASPEGEYMRLVEKADSAIAAENFVLAIESLEQAMRNEPGNPGNIMLLSNKGMLHYYLGEDSLALAALDAAREMAPASVTVLMNRARVLHGTGRPADALVDYTLVTEMDSTLADAWIQKGMLQLRGGDVRGAEVSLAKATQLAPDERDTQIAYALLYSHTNRPEQAIPYLNKVIKKEPQSEYYAERAMCRLRTDDLGGASEDIGAGLALDATNPDLYIARALLNRRRFREKDAMADADLALKAGADPMVLKAWGLTIEQKK